MSFWKKISKALSNKWVRAGLGVAGALDSAGLFGNNNIVSSAIGLGNMASGAADISRRGANFTNIGQLALGGYGLYRGRGFGAFAPQQNTQTMIGNPRRPIPSQSKALLDDDKITVTPLPAPTGSGELMPMLKPGTVPGAPASPTAAAAPTAPRLPAPTAKPAAPAATPMRFSDARNSRDMAAAVSPATVPNTRILGDAGADPSVPAFGGITLKPGFSSLSQANAALNPPAAKPVGTGTGFSDARYANQNAAPRTPPGNFAQTPPTPRVAAPAIPTTTMQTSGGGQSLAPNPNAPFVGAPLQVNGESVATYQFPTMNVAAAVQSPPVATTQAAAQVSSQQASSGLQEFAGKWIDSFKNRLLEQPELALQAGSALIGLFAADPAEVAAKAYAKEKAEILKRMDPASDIAKEYGAAYTETRKQQLDEMYKLQRAQLAAVMAQRGMTDSTVAQQAFLDMDSKYAELSSKIPYDAQQAWLTYSQALLANYGVAATGAAQAAQVAAGGAASSVPSFGTLGQSLGTAAAGM